MTLGACALAGIALCASGVSSFYGTVLVMFAVWSIFEDIYDMSRKGGNEIT
jgi:hypothetical protein